jgi:hypothetical protein
MSASDSFCLDAPALERVFALWNLPLPKSGLVLFALRGAVPGSNRKGWQSAVDLTRAAPDYRHMRCTLGLWNRTTGKVFAAPGSTVPHLDNVVKAAARKGAMQGRGTNQLEPGYYTDLTKGEHLQGKPQGHAALRQTGSRFYRRARPFKKGAAPYTGGSPLYFGNPYDNLHCAWNKNAGAEGFRSAGCLVVAGWPHSPRLPDAQPNEGPWKAFHDLLYAAPQKSFPLLLLPAPEVEAALRGSRKPEPRGPRKVIPGTYLVYGSEGPAVENLQRRLAAKGFYKGRITGKLGVSTYRAWNQEMQGR